MPRALVGFVLVLSCSAPLAPSPARTELGGPIFASRWRVVISHAVDAPTRSALQGEVEAVLRAVEGRLSAWKKDSEIVRCHDVGAGVPCPISVETATLVKTCLGVTHATGGAFDVTLAPLLDAWGFSPSTRGRVREAPSAAVIAEALQRVDATAVRVHDGARPALVRTREDVRLDVTAVTDGAAADAVARLLWERGWRHFLVDVAGEVVVAGTAEGRAGGRAWRVGISDPGRHGDEAPADPDVAKLTLDVDAGAGMRAVSTSGTTRDTRVAGGRTVSHILDPRTGEPVVNDLVSCTILGTDAVLVDALSTACLVLGRAETEAILSRFPGSPRMHSFAVFSDGRVEGGVGSPSGSAEPPISTAPSSLGANRTAGSVVPD